MEHVKGLWSYISSFGIQGEMDDRMARKVKLTNQLAFLGASMTFIQLFAFAGKSVDYALICAGSIMLYGGTWVINSHGKWNTARLYFALVSCLVILIGGSMVTETSNVSFRFMMIQALVIPLVVFDYKERFLQLVGFMGFILSFLIFDMVNGQIPVLDGIDPIMFDSPQMLMTNGILCMITLLIGYRYLHRLNLEAENGLQHALDISRAQQAVIVEKNEEVLEGLRYAERIQTAVLPKKEDISVYFPDNFIYFKPKDTIGGDFYWYGETNGHLLMAAVDCTGHGTPGALISIIGSQMLDKLVKGQGLTDPAEILEILNIEVISTLQSKDSVLKDGMDISLLSIDTVNKTVRFAGAKNSLIIIRDEEVIRIKGDRASIGQSHIMLEGFTTQEVEIRPDDSLFMFTDGVIDQFGGPENKKMLSKRLYASLRKNHIYNMDIQSECLAKDVQHWQGTAEQTDDILVMGLRIDFEHISQVCSFSKFGIDTQPIAQRAAS